MQTFKESRLVFQLLSKEELEKIRKQQAANREEEGFGEFSPVSEGYPGRSQGGVKTPSIFKGGPRIGVNAPADKTSAFDEGIEQATGEPIDEGIAEAVDAGEKEASTYEEYVRQTIERGRLTKDEWEKQKAASGQTGLTPEQIKALEEGQAVAGQTPTQIREGEQALGTELGLGTDIAATPAEIAAKRLATQAAETKFSDEEEARIRELENLGIAGTRERFTRLGEAGRALLGGREGAVSGARRGIPSAIQTGGRIRVNLAEKQIKASRKRREELERRRRAAQKENNNALASSLQKEINSEKLKEANAVSKIQLELENAETEATKAETEAAKAETEAQTAAQKEAQAQLDVITNLPAEAFESLSAQDLGAQFEAAGLPFSLGGALKNAQMELAVAQKGKDETAILQAQATLAKTIAEVQQIGKPAASALEGKMETLNSLLSAGTISQDQFDSALEVELGIAEKDGEKFGFKEVDGKLYATDPKTGKATLVSTDAKGNPIAPQFSDVGNGNITQNYGAPSPSGSDDPLLQNGTFGTPGVDIDGITGDTLQAFVEGTVSSIAENGGYGNQVVITDNAGNQHMYSHLRELPAFLAKGQKVKGGDVVGYMGNTGKVYGIKGNEPKPGDTETGSHLDYRIKGAKSVNGSPWINPNNFLADRPTKFQEELRPLYKKYNTGKMTKEDWATVSDLDLSRENFIKQSANSKSTSEKDVAGVEFAEDILKTAIELKKSIARTTAAFGIGKIPFTESRDFVRMFDAFVNKLGLDNLVELKSRGATFGALSDTELQVLTNAATSLDIGMSEEAWDTELNKIISKMEKAAFGELPEQPDVVIQNINNESFLGNFPLSDKDYWETKTEETTPEQTTNK